MLGSRLGRGMCGVMFGVGGVGARVGGLRICGGGSIVLVGDPGLHSVRGQPGVLRDEAAVPAESGSFVAPV